MISITLGTMQIYEEGRLPFYHFDVYRIGCVEEMDEIGYEDCFYGKGVCFIEWADLIEEILPDLHILSLFPFYAVRHYFFSNCFPAFTAPLYH